MQDRLAEAAFRANIVVEGRRRQLGEGHPLYLASAGDLADLLLRQGRYERAASFATRAHDGWRTTLGDAHPESLDALDRLARTRLAQGRAEEALGMLSGALRLRTGAGLAETPAALASAHTLAHARFMTGREDEAIDGLRTLLDRLAGADDAGVRRSLAIALLRTGDREAAAEHASALASGDAPVSDRALAAIASGADVETLDALAQASKAELGPHAPTTVALTHALARALHATDPDRAADLYARALERTLAARPARTLDVFVPAAMEIAVDYAHLLLEQGRTAEAFDTIQRLRSFEAFDLFVRTASDRSILRTQLTPEQRATYEDLLGREADARATVYEAELRADELRALEGDPLGDARVAHADATRALVRFVLDACDTITPMGSAAIAQRLAPGRAYADIAATRERLLLFWVTADGVEGRVMSDDPQRIERLARAATRVRTQCIDPEGDDPRDSGALVTLRNGLLPAELRRLLNDGIGSCALTISAPFDYTPMSLLAPNAAIARTPTASGVFTSSTDDTPTRTLALTADTPDTPDADARLVDALASLTADPFSRYDAASGSADAMRARIAEVAPTRLHAAIPVWLDAQVSSGFLPDYAAAPSVFDLVDTLGLRTNALRLVALPDARPHTPIVRTPRPDTIAPTLVGAGVRNALYLLWEQDPDASALLVARFYANTDGRTGAGAMPAGEALLEAQRWLRTLTRDRIADAEDLATLATSPIDSDASGDRAYTHPRYWSGFVLAGAPWGEGVAGE
ncbi:MAG: CHAT domain-containing protein [Planctomycetota bacterium]